MCRLFAVFLCIVVHIFFCSSLTAALRKSRSDPHLINASAYSLVCLQERTHCNTSSWFFSDLVLNSVSYSILAIAISYFIALCGTILLNSFEVNIEKIASQDFAALTDDMASLSLSASLGVLGLLSLFGAFPRAYSAAINTTDLISFRSVRENVLCSLLCFSFAFSVNALEKVVKYFTPDQHSRLSVILYLSIFSYGLYLSSLTYAGLAALKIVCSFDEGTYELNKLYKNIRHYSRKNNEKLSVNNKEGIITCYNYYWSGLLDSSEGMIEHRNFRFISLQDHYQRLSLTTRLWVWIKSSLYLAIITAIPSSLIAYILLPDEPVWWHCANISLAINFAILIFAFFFNTPYQKFYIRATIGAWGFEVINQSQKCFFNERWHCSGYQYRKQLRIIYSIVSFFRNALQAGEEVSQFSLKQIFRNAKESNCGYILCFVCSYLFKEYYPESKADFRTDLLDIVKTTSFDISLLRDNALELIKDILSDGKERYYPEYWPSTNTDANLSLRTIYSYTIETGDVDS